MTAQPNVIPIQPDNPSLSRLRDLVEQQWQTHGPESAIDGLRLTHALEPSGTIRALYQTSFCIVLQGAKVTAVGESAFHYRQGECLLASVNVPVNSRIVQASPDMPYLALSLSIDPAMISELLVTHPEMAYRGPKQPALVTAGMPDDLYDPVIRLLRLLDQPDDREVLEPLVRREICWRILRSPLGPALQQIGLTVGALDCDRFRLDQRIHYAGHVFQPDQKTGLVAHAVVDGDVQACAMGEHAVHACLGTYAHCELLVRFRSESICWETP